MSVSSGKRPSSFFADEEAPESEELIRSPARKQKRAVWSVDDLKILQEAKRHDQEKFLRGGRKEKQKTSAERWAKISVVCAKEGVKRTPGQCKQKWENLAVDWNKITDYNRSCRKGTPVYWGMTAEERKRKGLPPSFSKDLFNLVEVWYPRCRAAILDPRLISDISDTAMSTSSSSADEGQAMQLDSELNSRPPSEILQGNCDRQMYGIEHPAPAKIPEFEHPVPSVASDYAVMDYPVANGHSPCNPRNTCQDEDQGGQPFAKKAKRFTWTLDDLLILQAARRNEKERSSKIDAHRTVQERWAAMASYCAANGLVRAPESCRQKWEQMATDWKKINDHDNSLEAGATSYWELSGDERKAMKLPFSFARELFNAIESWYPRNKISVPDKATVDMNLRALAAEKALLESEIEKERARLLEGLGALSAQQPSYVSVDTTLPASESAKQSRPSFATAAPPHGSISTPVAPSVPTRRGAPAVAMRSSLSGLVLGSTVSPTPGPGGVHIPQGISPPSTGPDVDWNFLQSCMNGISGQLERMAAHPPDREQMGQATRDMESRLLQRFSHLEKLLGDKVDNMLGRVAAFSGTVENLEAKYSILAHRVDSLSGSVQTLIKSVDNMEVEGDRKLAAAVVQLKNSIAAIEERAWARSINACSTKVGDRVEHLTDMNLCVPQNFPKTVEDVLKMGEADLNGLLDVYGLSREGTSSSRKLRLANYFGLRITFE